MSAIDTPCTADVCHPAVISKSSKKRWIPADLVQNTAEYSGSVASLVSFRGVSSMWQDAVSDAVGFLNGRCWTQLEVQTTSWGPLWMSLRLDDPTAVARCALLCLAHRLETLTWWFVADELDFLLQLLCENNTVLTTLSLEYRHSHRHRPPTVDVSRLQTCRALKKLDLADSRVTDAGMRGLELIPTLEVLELEGCKQITDVSCLQSCRALKQLDLTDSSVTNVGVRGLELIPTLEVLNLAYCKNVTDVSCLRSCRALNVLFLSESNVTDAGIRGLELILTLKVLTLERCKEITDVSFLQRCCALKKLYLSQSTVTDAGIRGVELIPTLEVLNLSGCTKLHDVSALRNRPGLQIVAPDNTILPL
jgi:hypothetical protein